MSALEYLKILEGEQILDRHDEIVTTTNEVIESKGYHVLNRFGLYYMIRKDKDAMLYMIPMNATDQYFYHLGKNLK